MRMELTGELTIVTAADHYRLIRSFLTTGAPLELGLSGVTDLDTAGLQLLLLARLEASRLGTEIAFAEPSPAVAAVLSLAHIDGALRPSPAPDTARLADT